MRICAFSDMHGQYDFTIEPCDIVLICGDIIPLRIQRDLGQSLEWIKSFFIPWCNSLPCEKVVFIGGNHDFLLQKESEKLREALKSQDKIIYLDCEYYEYNGKTIYGTPWCKPFFNWAFMEEEKASDERYKDVQHMDILITHDAPHGLSDILLQEDCPWADGKHIGNNAIKRLISKTKPALVFHGHLHSTNHEPEVYKKAKIFNVSLLDERYEMVYKPLYIELE